MKCFPDFEERMGLVVECLTADRMVVSLRLTGGTVLCPYLRHIIPFLVLVTPRKTGKCLDTNEKLLTVT